MQYIPAIILFIILLIQVINRSFVASKIRYFFWIPVIIIFEILLYQSGAQYFAWLTGGPVTANLLPPAQPISYYIFYVFTRFWLPYLLSLAFAGVAYLVAKYLNKKYDERFFYTEEYYLIALSFFLCVHPFWIGFLIFTLLGYVIYSLITTIRHGSNERASFYYLWLPSALIISLLTPWLMTLPFLAVLKV